MAVLWKHTSGYFRVLLYNGYDEYILVQFYHQYIYYIHTQTIIQFYIHYMIYWVNYSLYKSYVYDIRKRRIYRVSYIVYNDTYKMNQKNIRYIYDITAVCCYEYIIAEHVLYSVSLHVQYIISSLHIQYVLFMMLWSVDQESCNDLYVFNKLQPFKMTRREGSKWWNHKIFTWTLDSIWLILYR